MMTVVKIAKVVLLLVLLLHSSLLSAEEKSPKYTPEIVPKKMSVQTKKARFYYLLLPPIKKVYSELEQQYIATQKDLNNSTNSESIVKLKETYDVETDAELLQALKPHPMSITIAQAAMESAWGTSRFFREAYNTFGMWNNDQNASRIAAGESRSKKHTVWLSKYETLEDSVRAYYKTLAKGKTYIAFREVKMNSDDVYELVKKLDKYSERGEDYTKEIASMIRYNKLTKYDQ